MANIILDVKHKNANSLAVGNEDLRKLNGSRLSYSTASDECVDAMKKAYKNLSKTFDTIANLCSKALKDSNIAVDSIKNDLKDAKKKAACQSAACTRRREQITTKYETSKEMKTILESYGIK